MPYVHEMNLIQAAKIGLYTQTERCLTKNPPDPIHMSDNSGLNALHWATLNGHWYLLDLLASHHADLESTAFSHKMTAILLAATEHQPDSLTKLIALGAKTDYVCEHGANALQYALISQVLKHQMKLVTAPEFQNFKTIEILLRLNTLYTPELQPLIDLALADAIEVDYVDFLNTLIDQQIPINTTIVSRELPIPEILYHALTHNAIDCLKRFTEWNPELIKVPIMPFRLLGLNLFHFLTPTIPESACFELARTVSDVHLSTEEELTACLQLFLEQHPALQSHFQLYCQPHPVTHDRLCVQAIETRPANRTIYFEPNGEVLNTDHELEKLNQTIQFLKNQGCDINQVSSQQSSPARALLCTPREIIEIFIKNGLKFSGEDLAYAIKNSRADVVACLLENHTDVCWKDENNQNAVALLESGAYPQLINDPLFEQLLILARAEFIRQQYPGNRPIHASQSQIIPDNALILDPAAATFLYQLMTGTLSEVDNQRLAELESEEHSGSESDPEAVPDMEVDSDDPHQFAPQ